MTEVPSKAMPWGTRHRPGRRVARIDLQWVGVRTARSMDAGFPQAKWLKFCQHFLERRWTVGGRRSGYVPV